MSLWLGIEGGQIAVPPVTFAVDYLVVGGGGGSGALYAPSASGGGGGGGYLAGTLNVQTGVGYSLKVGAGGNGG